ncbi:MAG: type VI secretion system contractile sheath large subunit [Gemmatimonadota bacterium]|nr:MAG: type VI secretion system contractile sheath large subunit [Gemmatimonadota bacterium]
MSDEQPDLPEIVVEVRREPATSELTPDSPFRVALLGDFSGRGARGQIESGQALALRKPVRVDRDNLDKALARLGLQLDLALWRDSDSTLSLRFAELEDFHPDRLYQRLALFEPLREVRRRLQDPATAAQAIEELRGGGPHDVPEPEMPEPRAIPENLLEQILTESAGPAAAELIGDDLGAYLKRIVAPHRIPELDPQGLELARQVDAASAELMRRLLHHPEVQALEARWRAVHLLTRRIETGSQLQFHIIDLSRAELEADLSPDLDLERTGLYKLLVESSVGTPGAPRWALLVGDYTFGPGPQDAELMARLAAIGSLAGAPWISAAHPRIAGCESFHATPDPAGWLKESAPAWVALRGLPLAAWLGLAAPRFLLRTPYGEETEPCEFLPFEEMPGTPEHDHYLWGSPAFACALLLAMSFAAAGWEFQPGMHSDITGLPLHLYEDDGDTVSKPCAEVLLTERAAARLLDRGVMPLASLKGADAVRLVRFQSVASPSAPLAGPWGSSAGQ